MLKNEAPTAASAMAQIDSIMENENEVEQGAALIELSQALSNISVDGAGYSSCYLVATGLNDSLHSAPNLDSSASTTFITSDDYLANPHKHKTSITAANGNTPFTKSSGKLKITNTSTPNYFPALPAPEINQNLIKRY